MSISVTDVAKMIDHSLLKPTVTNFDVETGCALARKYDVASVCVKPVHAQLAWGMLAGSRVVVSAVCGFPHGNSLTAIKVMEVQQAMAEGATEIDTVVNIGAVLSDDWQVVEADVKAVTEAVHAGGGLIKVIFENCYLEDRHKIRLCHICDAANVDWLKTSTGFGTREGRFYGATDHDLRLMRANVSERIQLKAAGGVRTLERLLEVRDLGCTRAGATATEAIMLEALRTLPR